MIDACTRLLSLADSHPPPPCVTQHEIQIGYDEALIRRALSEAAMDCHSQAVDDFERISHRLVDLDLPCLLDALDAVLCELDDVITHFQHIQSNTSKKVLARIQAIYPLFLAKREAVGAADHSSSSFSLSSSSAV